MLLLIKKLGTYPLVVPDYLAVSAREIKKQRNLVRSIAIDIFSN